MQHRSGFEGRSPPLHAMRINRVVLSSPTHLLSRENEISPPYQILKLGASREPRVRSIASSDYSAVSVRIISKLQSTQRTFVKKKKNRVLSLPSDFLRSLKRDDQLVNFIQPHGVTTPSTSTDNVYSRIQSRQASCCDHELLRDNAASTKLSIVND